jgi:hypothetical protein
MASGKVREKIVKKCGKVREFFLKSAEKSAEKRSKVRPFYPYFSI